MKRRKVIDGDDLVSHFVVGGVSFHLPAPEDKIDGDIADLLNNCKRRFFSGESDNITAACGELSSFVSASFAYLGLASHAENACALPPPAHDDASARASSAQSTFCGVLCTRLTKLLASLSSAVRDAELRSDDVGSFVDMLLFYFNLHKAVLDEIPALGCFRLKYPALQELVTAQAKDILNTLLYLLVSTKDYSQFKLTSQETVGDLQWFVILQKLVIVLELGEVLFWDAFNDVVEKYLNDVTANTRTLMAPWLALLSVARVVPIPNWKFIPKLFDITSQKMNAVQFKETRTTSSSSHKKACVLRMSLILKRLAAVWYIENDSTKNAYLKFWQHFRMEASDMKENIEEDTQDDECIIFLQAVAILFTTKQENDNTNNSNNNNNNQSDHSNQNYQNNGIDNNKTNEVKQKQKQLQQQAQRLYSSFFMIGAQQPRPHYDEQFERIKNHLASSSGEIDPPPSTVTARTLRNNFDMTIAFAPFVPPEYTLLMVKHLSGTLDFGNSSVKGQAMVLDALFTLFDTLQKREITSQTIRDDLAKACKECATQINTFMAIVLDEYIIFKRPPPPLPRPPAPLPPPPTPLPANSQQTNHTNKTNKTDNVEKVDRREIKRYAPSTQVHSNNNLIYEPPKPTKGIVRLSSKKRSPSPPLKLILAPPLPPPPPAKQQDKREDETKNNEDKRDKMKQEEDKSRYWEAERELLIPKFTPMLEATIRSCLSQALSILHNKPLGNPLLDEPFPFWECKFINQTVEKLLATGSLFPTSMRQAALNIVRAILERLKFNRPFGEPEKWLQTEVYERVWQPVRGIAAESIRHNVSPKECIQFSVETIAEMAPLVAPLLPSVWDTLVKMYGPNSFMMTDSKKEVRSVALQFFKRMSGVFPEFVTENSSTFLQMWILSLIGQPLGDKDTQFSNCLLISSLSSHPLLRGIRLNKPATKTLQTLSSNLHHCTNLDDPLIPAAFATFLQRIFSEIFEDHAISSQARTAHVRATYAFACGLLTHCIPSLLVSQGSSKSLLAELCDTCFISPNNSFVEVALENLQHVFRALSSLSFTSSPTILTILGKIYLSNILPPQIPSNTPNLQLSEKRLDYVARALAAFDTQFTPFRRFVIWHVSGFIMQNAVNMIPACLGVLTRLVEEYKGNEREALVEDFQDFLWLLLKQLSSATPTTSSVRTAKACFYLLAKKLLDKLTQLDYFATRNPDDELVQVFKGIAFQAGYDLYLLSYQLLVFSQKKLKPIESTRTLPPIQSFMDKQVNERVIPIQRPIHIIPALFSYLQSLSETTSDHLRFYLLDLMAHMHDDLLSPFVPTDSPPEESPPDEILPALPSYIPASHFSFLRPLLGANILLPNQTSDTSKGIKQVCLSLGGSWAGLFGGLQPLPLF